MTIFARCEMAGQSSRPVYLGIENLSESLGRSDWNNNYCYPKTYPGLHKHQDEELCNYN